MIHVRDIDHVVLRVADARKAKAHLRAHGIEPSSTGTRFGAEGEGVSVYITDPDGNVVELKGPPTA